MELVPSDNLNAPHVPPVATHQDLPLTLHLRIVDGISTRLCSSHEHSRAIYFSKFCVPARRRTGTRLSGSLPSSRRQ